MFCSKCGEKNIESAKFCKKCGGELKPTVERTEKKTEEVERIKEPSREKEEERGRVTKQAPRKFGKKFTLIVIIIAVAALGVIAFFFFHGGDFFNNLKEKAVFKLSLSKEAREVKEKEQRTASYKTFELGVRPILKYPADWVATPRGEKEAGPIIAHLQKDKDVWMQFAALGEADFGRRTLEEGFDGLKKEMSANPDIALLIAELNPRGFVIEAITKFDPNGDPFASIPEDKKAIMPRGHFLMLVIKLNDKAGLNIMAVTPEEKWSSYQKNITDVIDSINIAPELISGIIERQSESSGPVSEETVPSTSTSQPSSVAPASKDKILRVTASSVLQDPYGDYSPQNIIDGDTKTAWCVKGNGEEEWIQIDFRESVLMRNIGVFPGFGKSEDFFLYNNRPKGLKIEYSNGSSNFIYTIPQFTTSEHGLAPTETTYLKLTINGVYEGTKYNDTCISEIDFESPNR